MEPETPLTESTPDVSEPPPKRQAIMSDDPSNPVASDTKEQTVIKSESTDELSKQPENTTTMPNVSNTEQLLPQSNVATFGTPIAPSSALCHGCVTPITQFLRCKTDKIANLPPHCFCEKCVYNHLQKTFSDLMKNPLLWACPYCNNTCQCESCTSKRMALLQKSDVDKSVNISADTTTVPEVTSPTNMIDSNKISNSANITETKQNEAPELNKTEANI